MNRNKTFLLFSIADDWNMFWNGCLDTALLENTQLSLLHTLLDQLKADLSTDYQEITTKLSE
jgi:hypothetical protein